MTYREESKAASGLVRTGLIILTTLIAAGLTSCAAASTAKSIYSASTSATPVSTPTPETTPAVSNLAEQIALHEIKPNADPTVVAQDIIKELSNWEMSGSDTVVNAWVAYGEKNGDASDTALSAFLDEFSAEQTKIYGPALFGVDYASNDQVQNAVAGFASINRATLQNIIATKRSKETLYTRSISFVSLGGSSSTNGQTELSINFKDTDNAGQGNSVPVSINDQGSVITVSEISDGTKITITSMQ